MLFCRPVLPPFRQWDFLKPLRSLSFSSSASLEESNKVTSTEENNMETLKRQLDPDDFYMIQRLMEYREKYGDCHVPTGRSVQVKGERQKLGVSEDLATWIVNQRALHRRYYYNNANKIRKMSDALAVKFLVLESIGFMWSCRESAWQRNFNRLERYSQENGGSTRVSKKEDPLLFCWCDHQRTAFHNGKLAPEREALLREIGFVFDLLEANWRKHYEQLCRYKEEHGDALVPTTGEPHSFLGSWVARQRHLYKVGRLEEHRIRALNEIGFVWEVQNSSWDMYYAQLLEFFREHGHTRVPRSAGPLWSWTDRQRVALKRLTTELLNNNEISSDDIEENFLEEGNLKKLLEIGLGSDDDDTLDNDDRAKRLMDLTFEVAVHDEKWMKWFRELCAFKDKYGHFSVPGTRNYRALSNWVRHQRYSYRQKMLPENRVALLNEIGFAWTAELARWNRMYDELLSFHQLNGHAKVPSKNAGLYRWTIQQRRNLLATPKPTSQRMTGDMAKKMMVLREILIE